MSGASFLFIASNRSIRRPGQMGETIFFSVTRHAKFEARIAQFRLATGRTAMQRFLVGTRLNLKTLASNGDLFALPQLLNHAGPEEDELIAERGDQRQAKGIRLRDKRQQQKRRIHPGDPFDLQRQDKEDVDDLGGIKMGEREE